MSGFSEPSSVSNPDAMGFKQGERLTTKKKRQKKYISYQHRGLLLREETSRVLRGRSEVIRGRVGQGLLSFFQRDRRRVNEDSKICGHQRHKVKAGHIGKWRRRTPEACKSGF